MRYSKLRYLFTIILIGLAAFFIYSKFKGYSYNIPQLFREANKLFLIVLLFLQAFSYFSNALLSKTLFKIAGFDMQIKDAISIAVLSILGGQVAPVLGSVAITFYFYKKFNLPSGTILFLVTSWNLAVVFVHILFFLLSLIFISPSYFHIIPRQVTLTFLFLTIALLVINFLLIRRRGRGLLSMLHFINKTINKISKKFREKPLIRVEKPKKFGIGAIWLF